MKLGKYANIVNDILLEDVTPQYLYHGMWKDQYEYCKKQNKLFGHYVSETFFNYNKKGERIGRRIYGISTSRNAQVSINFMENIIKEYTNEWKSNPSAIFSKKIGDNEKYVTKDDDLSYVVLVLDYNKIKQNHKVIPFSFLAGSQKDYYGDEQEELIVGELKNLNNYVVDVMEFNNNINKETIKSKTLEEAFVKNPFSNEVLCYYSKLESEVKQIIKNKFNDIPVRVLYDFVNKVYIFGNANTLIHVDLIDKMKQYGKTDFGYRYPIKEEEQYKWMDKNCAMFKIINTNDYKSYTRSDGYKMGVIGKLDTDMYVILRDNTLAMERSKITGNFVPDELQKCKKVPMLQNVKFVKYDIRDIGMFTSKEQLPQKLVNESVEPKLNDNFWKWFGNSKVVDENGNPLVVYHGTRSQFNEFDRKYAKRGFFFTTKKRKNSVAGYYAYYNDDKGSILPCYIKLENPLIVHRPNGNEDDIARANGTLSNYDGIIVLYDDKDDWEFSDYDYIEKKRKPLTIKNGEVIEYIVFDPNNIKSVNNNGNWSTTSNNINESASYGGANWQNSMDALGNVPATIGHNLFMTMFPYHFLSLCPKFSYGDDKFFDDYIESKKPIGIPFLIVDFNFDKKAIEVQDHEGRHRVAAISRRKNGNIVDIPVALLYSKNRYPQIPSIEELRKNWTIVSQKGDREYNVGQFSLYNSFPKSTSDKWFNLYESLQKYEQEYGAPLFVTNNPYDVIKLSKKYTTIRVNVDDTKNLYIIQSSKYGLHLNMYFDAVDNGYYDFNIINDDGSINSENYQKQRDYFDNNILNILIDKDERYKDDRILDGYKGEKIENGILYYRNDKFKNTKLYKILTDNQSKLYENKLADVQEDMKWILSSDSILFSCYPPSYHIMLKCIKDNNVEVFEFNFKDKAEKYVKLCRSLLARFEKGFKAYTIDTLMKKIDTYDGVPISKDGVRTILNAYYGQLI